VLWFAVLGIINVLYLWIYRRVIVTSWSACYAYWFSRDRIFHLLLFPDVAGSSNGERPIVLHDLRFSQRWL
jgi:hypothetical protein